MPGDCVNLVIVISADGFKVVRIPDDPDFVKPVTVEMQAENPSLGLICASRNPSELLRALNSAVSDATGMSEDLFILRP